MATSLLCAYLLLRAYFRSRSRLLIWSSICFGMLALNNLVLAVDVLLLPENDLTLVNNQFNADGSLNQSRLQPKNAGFGAANSARTLRNIQLQLRFQF